MRTRVSNRARRLVHIVFRNPQDPDGPNLKVAARVCSSAIWKFRPRRGPVIRPCPQLHPWLVPHSVQTPQAPARMTLSLPQTEQVMPMKMLPSATVTRYDEVPAPLPFPSGVPPFPGLDE